MTQTRLMTVATAGAPRATTLSDLVERAAARGWLEPGAGRVVIRLARAGRTALVGETGQAIAASLGQRFPRLAIEVDDAAGAPVTAGADDAVEVQGMRGARLRVPRSWFEPFFLITVAGVHRHRRWRVGAVLAAQAEALAAVNPRMPAGVRLAEAHRLGRADLAVACGSHPSDGDWWAISPSDILVDAAVARAAGIDARRLPAIRAIARHELLESWEEMGSLPSLPHAAAGAMGAALRAAAERATDGARRSVEDVLVITRNLRKVPGALQRRLAARAGGRASA